MVVIVALLAASGAMAARPDADALEFYESLRGKMLIAKPSMSDRRFAHAVILIVRHDAEGAYGLVVNQPLGSVELKDKTTDTAADTAADRATDTRDEADESAPPAERRSFEMPAFAGGPVAQGRAFVIHSTDYWLDTTIPVARGLAVTADPRILADIIADEGPEQLLYLVGYTSWAAGQLEDEMRREDWYITPADADIVFGPEDAETKWENALELR